MGIAVGSKVGSVNINNVNMTGTNKAGSIGVYCTNSQANISAAMCEQYATPSKIAGKTYTFIPNNFKGGTRIATTSGYAKTKTSVVIASSGGGQATGDASAVIATTGGSKAEGPRNAVIASSGALKQQQKEVAHWLLLLIILPLKDQDLLGLLLAHNL